MTDKQDVVLLAEDLLKDITKFIQENIIKVDVKITQGPLLKEARKLIANGLRTIAKLVENPDADIKLIDVKKNK